MNDTAHALLAAALLVLTALALRRPASRRRPPSAGRGDVVLSLTPHDAVTLHQIYEGCLILGTTGSGKTTGPGEELARNLLRRGAGFCVLCAKPDEYGRWERLCRQTGRSADLVRFAPGGPWRCDLLNYSLSYCEATVEASAQLLATLLEVQGRQGDGRADEPFWRLASEKHFRRAIHAVWRAEGGCSLTDVYRLIASAPTSPEEAASPDWRRDSYCGRCVAAAAARHPEDYDVATTAAYWLSEYAGLSDRTRSIIHAMTTNVLDKFLFGDVARMVAGGGTNFTPEHIHNGAVCVLDMPYLTWRDPGRFFAILFKTLVQRATLRRDAGGPARPVVLWQDEGQLFLTEQDVLVQTVARQARLVSVFLSQSLPVLYEALGGGPRAQQQAHALIGNLQTKLLCQQSDRDTNDYFAALVGPRRELFFSGGHSDSQPYDPVLDFLGQRPSNAHAGFSEQLTPELLPGDFQRLAKGGPEYSFLVSCLCFQGGRRFSDGRRWVTGTFRQRV